MENFLEILTAGRDLSDGESVEFFTALQTATDENLIAAALLAFEAKGATESELLAMARLMRRRAVRVRSRHETFVDIVGTGGSRAKIFNVSTAAAFVVAGANVPVAKHGNRAATSKCGSADVLSELNVNPAVEAGKAAECLNEIGICFMFAPVFHRLSPILGKVRRELNAPTVFNNLGPLCNPANAPHQIIGVWNENLLAKTARVLEKLGTRKSWIVHGADGLDEITLAAETSVAEIADGKIEFFDVAPHDFGLSTAKDLRFPKCSAKESARLLTEILSNRTTDENARNIVLINAAAAIYAAGKADNLPDALAVAETSLKSGNALAKLNLLVEKTNENVLD